MDVTSVKAGTIVCHKGYGYGRVKGIDGRYIIVEFHGVAKKFYFPEAFERGFLSLE